MMMEAQWRSLVEWDCVIEGAALRKELM
jgi:hypothetical protein